MSCLTELKNNPMSKPEDSERIMDDSLYNEIIIQRKIKQPFTKEEQIQMDRYALITRIIVIKKLIKRKNKLKKHNKIDG
jgi:hypothetical protein